MNAGEHDGSGETMRAAPFPKGRDISGRYSAFTFFQIPYLQVPKLGKGRLIKLAHAPSHFQMNRRHCEDKIVNAVALGFSRQDTINYLHMSKYEGRISLQEFMILKLGTGKSLDERVGRLKLKRIEIKIHEKYQPESDQNED